MAKPGPLVVPDLAADPRFLPYLTRLRDKGLRSYCWLPLTTAESVSALWAWGVFS